MEHLTSIGRIGLIKRSGNEWIQLKKRFTVPCSPLTCQIRVESMGVCGIYLNGTFLEAITGRYPNRVLTLDCGSLLKPGENEIQLVLGDHYYQTVGNDIYQRRGARFNTAAAELTAVSPSGSEFTLVTDDSWECESDDGQTKPICFSQVTKAEYHRFWTAAARWCESKKIAVPNAVLAVAGQAYKDYVSAPMETYHTPETILQTNMDRLPDGSLVAGGEKAFVLYDYGKLYVGYTEIAYTADADGEITLRYDINETINNFPPKSHAIEERLAIREPLKKGHHTLFVLRRRAGRYLHLSVTGGTVRLRSVRMRLSMMPYTKLGWFHCPDSLLNQAWEVGKYTLHVNKHEEYESCPRNEMKYFSGDGIMEALVDYYTFGDPNLTKASLAITELESNVGIRRDKHQRNVGLWDYPAWRIIHAYNHYRYFGDTAFVKEHYQELAGCLEWMIERMNNRYLICQYPVFSAPVFAGSGDVEYSSNPDRLGTKPSLNALFCKSLMCMSQLAEVVGDETGRQWKDLADKVRAAINTELWSEEKAAYLDDFNTSYIPQDGNALALLFGIADPQRAKAVRDTLQAENWTPYGSTILSTEEPLIRNKNRTISPVMCTYEAEARFLQGDPEGALELIHRCWGSMLKKGAGTFWEFAPNDDTRWPIPAHGWAAGCTYLLSAYVLGIRPATPGYRVIRFAPYGGFDHFAGVVPTPHGPVAVRCETVDGTRKYTLAIPSNTELELALPENTTAEIQKYES